MTVTYYRWPDGILPPEPLNEQYKLDPPDATERVEMEQGAAEQFTIFRNPPAYADVLWPMTPAQLRIFDGVNHNQLKGGWFVIPVFTNADYEEVAVRIVAKSQQRSRSGGEWMVAVRLELQTMPMPDIYETALLMLTYGYDGDAEDVVGLLGDIENALHVFVHTTLPDELIP